MARRAAYTKIERQNFYAPAHIKGMGDKGFRGFQCLNKDCTEYLFIESESIEADFEIECPTCNFVHKAGETTTLFDYRLLDKRNGIQIESGPFEILHDDYVGEAKEYKYCIICGSLKPFELFDIHRPRKTGRQGECRVCKQVYNSIKNQTRLTEQHREASQKRRLYTHFASSEKMDITAIYKRFENSCFKCGLDLAEDLSAGSEKKWGNLDHTLPVYYLWPLTTNNATLLCREHNGKKAEKWPGAYYSDTELRKLASKTGIDYRLMAGEPIFNPDTLEQLKDPAFVENLFNKFARHPNELLRLRNRILDMTGFDFLDVEALISGDWNRRADLLRNG